MRTRLHGLVFLFPALLSALGSFDARADVIKQTAAIPLTAMDFAAGSTVLTGQDPLDFKQFDTQKGLRALDSVTIALQATTHNDFYMKFIQPATITDTVATDYKPAPVPTVTIYSPDGTTPALVLQTTSDPASLTRTVKYGFNSGETMPREFSSTLPATSPYYLAPANTNAFATATLTAPAALSQFTGTGPLSLPVTAAAFAKILIDSGNGAGMITTSGSANVAITYTYHNVPALEQAAPEPATLVVWGVTGAGALALGRLRRRSGSVSKD